MVAAERDFSSDEEGWEDDLPLNVIMALDGRTEYLDNNIAHVAASSSWDSEDSNKENDPLTSTIPYHVDGNCAKGKNKRLLGLTVRISNPLFSKAMKRDMFLAILR